MKVKVKYQLEFTDPEICVITELLNIANNVVNELENSDYVLEQDYNDWITTRNFLKEITEQIIKEEYN